MARIDLTGKPILITGASSGIGKATALACARAGMPVLAAARRADRLDALVGEIESAGGRAESVALDVNDADACAEAVSRCVETFGSIYAVFANAGFGIEGGAFDLTEDQTRGIFETNFFGSMHIIRPALARMRSQRAGHVLWCSSCLSILPTPYYAAYSASKAAQHHYGRAMRVELLGTGIHSTTVHPVGTKTEFFDTADKHSGGAKLFDKAEERLMQPPERVAKAIVRALRKPRAEVWTSIPARYGMSIVGRCPRLADMVFTRMKHKRLAEAREP